MKNTIKEKKNLRRAELLGKISLFLVSYIIAVLILCVGREPRQGAFLFPEGEPAPRHVFAPLEISFLNEKATALQKESASRTVPDVYDIDPKQNEAIFAALNEFFESLKQSKASLNRNILWDQIKVNLSSAAVKSIMEEDILFLQEWAKRTAKRFLDQGIMDFSRKMELVNEGKRMITVRGFSEGDKERLIALRLLRAKSDAVQEYQKLSQEDFPKNRKLRSALTELLDEVMTSNLSFNETETAARQKRVYNEAPSIFDEIKKGQMIVQKGSIVTPEIHSRLTAISAKQFTKQVQLKVLAIGLMVFLLYLVFGLFLRYFESGTFASFEKLVLIHSLLLVVLAAERYALNMPYGYIHYLLPACVYPLALSLLLNRRVGYFSAIVIAVFNALLTNFDTEVFLYSLLGSVVGTFSAIGLRKRSQFLMVSSSIGLANFLVIFSFNILAQAPFQEAVQLGTFGIVNGFVISMPILFLLLPLLEHLSGLTTDITLLELSDLNHPILRRMVIEAPGTYHHSLVVSSLAESACEAIGANGLLARVGGYFHDIGKMEKAQYFTENTANKQDDRHGKLSPSMSYLVIASHVKDGIELAKKHKLKQAIIDFIPQHQGTCPVYFFYKKASTNTDQDEKINIDDYRYPGPKPQNRETAVVLLADSVEAASRSLTNITPSSIEDMVKDVINGKFIDGQLEECDLTLQDVRKIQESFVHNLIGIFHTRIQYPKSDAEPLWQKIVDRKTE